MENIKSVLKEFHAFDGRQPIYYRPGTSDEAIIQAVLIDKKEYAFPKLKPEVVFDIGGNIGIVSVVLANIYPDAKIYTFEPVKENYNLLLKNIESYKNVKSFCCGLGSKSEMKTIHRSTDPTNLGGFSTYIKDGEADGDRIYVVETAKLCRELGTPDVIKIDVEGAEYDIISDIPDLENVKWITGELHGVDDYKLLGLLDKHFLLEFARALGDKVWHFHALTKKHTDLGLD